MADKSTKTWVDRISASYLNQTTIRSSSRRGNRAELSIALADCRNSRLNVFSPNLAAVNGLDLYHARGVSIGFGRNFLRSKWNRLRLRPRVRPQPHGQNW